MQSWAVVAREFMRVIWAMVGVGVLVVDGLAVLVVLLAAELLFEDAVAMFGDGSDVIESEFEICEDGLDICVAFSVVAVRRLLDSIIPWKFTG
jgi:hypothetical protein